MRLCLAVGTKEKEFRIVIIKGEKIYFVPVGEILKSTDKECLDYYEKQNSLPFKSFDDFVSKLINSEWFALTKTIGRKANALAGGLWNIICVVIS